MGNENPSWTVDCREGQRILSYCTRGETSQNIVASLFARGKLVEECRSDPERLAARVLSVGKPLPIVSPKQVHGDGVLEARRRMSLPAKPEADGLLITEPGILGSLQFADCYPVVMAGCTPRPWIVIGHSGFAGTGRRLVSAMAAMVSRTMGTGALPDALAWVGPGICSGCYDRKPEDPATQWGRRAFPSDCVILKKDGVHFDLGRAILVQLVDSGIPETAVSLVDLCTSCRNGVFYSYRKRDADQNVLLAGILPQGHKKWFQWENIYSGARHNNPGE